MMETFICNACWKRKLSTEFAEQASDEDLCKDCFEKFTRPRFAGDIGTSLTQISWAVSKINLLNRRVEDLEGENAKLRRENAHIRTGVVLKREM